MTKPNRDILFSLLAALTLFLSACSSVPGAPALAPISVATNTAMPTAAIEGEIEVEVSSVLTDTPTPSPTPVPTETATPVPTDTPVPEPTATPTQAPPTATPTPIIASVTVDVDLNARAGPGTDYNRVGLLPAGTTVEIIGRNDDRSWWQIVYPNAAGGTAWISSSYGAAINTEGVPLGVIPPTPTPSLPIPTPIPTVPPVDFVIVQQRLWTNEENGGASPNGSVTNCGYGHEIYVTVIDAAGNPLDGVVIGDIYNNPRQITGSIGPGRAQYLLYMNGYDLLVVEDTSAGRPVTSETSHVLSAKDEEIPIPWLMGAHYCATEGECVERVNTNNLCRGHYSYDIVFQRAW